MEVAMSDAQDDLLLRAARLSAARRRTASARRPLSPGVSALLWAMRLYVVLMIAVVAVQVARLA
jgi:hypothetical protein